ncbi:MAG: helix-turn-helix transcriptional regulator [Leifsonia sp.]
MSTPTTDTAIDLDLNLVRARAKVLAREDRELKAELIQIRRDAGMTQKQVADIMGVTRQAVQKLERYDSDPKFSTLRRYANAVGAIVEHRAVADVGQSVWMAAASPWEGLVAYPSQRVEAHVRAGQVERANNKWSISNRADFALAS